MTTREREVATAASPRGGDIVRCPDTTHLPPPEYGPLYVVGCGHWFVGVPDDEGLYDCPNCGMWFDDREQART